MEGPRRSASCRPEHPHGGSSRPPRHRGRSGRARRARRRVGASGAVGPEGARGPRRAPSESGGDTTIRIRRSAWASTTGRGASIGDGRRDQHPPRLAPSPSHAGWKAPDVEGPSLPRGASDRDPPAQPGRPGEDGPALDVGLDALGPLGSAALPLRPGARCPVLRCGRGVAAYARARASCRASSASSTAFTGVGRPWRRPSATMKPVRASRSSGLPASRSRAVEGR